MNEKKTKSIELTSIEYVLVFRFSALIQIKYNDFELKKINSIDDILLITEASSSFINRTHKTSRKKRSHGNAEIPPNVNINSNFFLGIVFVQLKMLSFNCPHQD